MASGLSARLWSGWTPTSAIRHAGYRTSQTIRKRIEEAFAWAKATAGFRKTRHRGLDRVGWQFTFTMAAYNLIRLPKLLATPG